jgi:hypothetical protein
VRVGRAGRIDAACGPSAIERASPGPSAVRVSVSVVDASSPDDRVTRKGGWSSASSWVAVPLVPRRRFSEDGSGRR